MEIDTVAAKGNVGRLQSKTHVSMEKPTEKLEATEATQKLQRIEIEMEQADHAFALMKEIRQRVEKAQEDISSLTD